MRFAALSLDEVRNRWRYRIVAAASEPGNPFRFDAGTISRFVAYQSYDHTHEG